MSDDAQPQAWGLWNATLRDWFNPGTSTRPWFATRQEAVRATASARRQWPLGMWVVTPYPVDGPPSSGETQARA